MKSSVKIICVILALFLLTPVLASCGNTLVYKNGKFTDKKSGSVFEYVYSSVYEPVAVSEEPYAIWKHNGVKVKYYAIEGLDPSEWLYSEFYELLCSTGEELPDLAGFEAESALICMDGHSTISLYKIEDREKINAIVEAYNNGEREEYPGNPGTSTYSLKFVSKTYPDLYYSLLLIADGENVYLYDRFMSIYVNMGDLFDEYDLYIYDSEYED